MGQSVGLPEVGEVRNLTSTLQPSGSGPSVALQWEAPRDVRENEVIAYDIRFRPKGSDTYSEESVDGSNKTITFTKASGLQPLKAYKFEVRARIGNTAGKWKAVSQYTALTPDPVLNLKAAVNKRKPSVTLNWDPPDSSVEGENCITKYDIRYKPEGGFYNEKTVGKSTTNIVLRRSLGLKPLLKYNFEVRARNAFIAGKWKTVVAFVALEPDPVQNLRAVAHLEGPSVDLNWNPPANASDAGNVTMYHIRFKPEGRERYRERMVDGSTTSVVLTRELGLILHAQITYDFGVRAQSGDCMGDWKTVSTYVGLLPGPVKDLAADVDLHQPSVTLSWEKPSNIWNAREVAAYEIHFKSSESDHYEERIEGCYTINVSFTREMGVEPLNTYVFKVRAKNRNGDGEWTTVSAYVGALVPGPVQNIRTVVDSRHASVRLNWDPPLNFERPGEVTAYNIRFKPNGRNTYDERTVDVTTTSILLTRRMGLKASTIHSFEVRAQNTEAKGEWKIVSTYVALEHGPVHNLSVAVDKLVPSVTLKWKPPLSALHSEESIEYLICFKVDGSTSWNHDKMIFAGSNTRVVLTRESGLVPLVHYHFQVRAKSGLDEGDCKEVSAFYGLIPGPVLNLKSTLDTSRPSLTLSWDKPNNVKTAGDVTKYDIRFRPFQTNTCYYRSQSRSKSGPREDYSKITVDEPTTSVFLTRESGLKPLIKYDFEVRARNTCHEGKWSTVSEYITLTPDPVQQLTADVEKHKPSVTLKWDPPANARYAGDVTKYQIRFWDKAKDCYNEKVVDGSTTTTIITRESGLTPLTTSTFEVRAYCGDDVSQEWRTVSTFVALIPDPVHNLKISVKPSVPTVTLTWEPPHNVKDTETQCSLLSATQYHIRFKPKGREHYNKINVDGSTTSMVLSRESGLIPLAISIFEVRAQCGDDLGKWKTISGYVALVPGPVKKLRQTLDTNQPSLTLNWDKPKNSKLPGEVTVYDVYFRPSGSQSVKAKHTTTTTPVKQTHQATSTPSSWSVDNALTATSSADPLMDTSLTSQWDILPSSSHSVFLQQELFSFLPHSIPLHLPESSSQLQSGIVSEADSHRRTLDALLFPPSSPCQPFHSHPLPLLTPTSTYKTQSGSGPAEDYFKVAVYAPATSIVLTRESGLKPLTKFDFEVRARNADHGGEWSAVSEYIALTPDPVRNLTATVDTHKPSVTLSWDPPANAGYSGDVTNYQIRFRDKKESCYTKKVVNGSTTTTVITRESGLRPLTTFMFAVRACSGDNISRDWKTASKFVALVPDPVCNLKISVDHNVPSVTLSWDPPQNVGSKTHRSTSCISRYHIRFKPNNRQHYDEMDVDGSTNNKIFSRESGLIPFTTSTFEVRAQCGDDLGKWNAISSYVGFVPGPVQSLTSSLDTSQPALTLNWDKPNNIKTTDDILYDIYFQPFKGKGDCSRWDKDNSETDETKSSKGIRSSSEFGYKTSTQTGIAGRGYGNALHHTYYSLPPTSHSLPTPTSACKIQTQNRNSSEQHLTVKAPKTSILLTRESGLIPLTTYDFKVRARSQDGVAKWRTVSAHFGLVPSPVQNLRKITDPKQASIRLIWDPPLNVKSPGEVTAYHICFKPCDKTTSDETTVDVTTTSILLTRSLGLKASTMYDFKVRALNAEHAATEWEMISAFIVLDPGPVQNLSADVDKSVPSLMLSWKPPVNVRNAEELTGYWIRFNPLGTENYEEMTVSGAAARVVFTRESSQLVALKHYHFQVKAQSARGEGEWSHVSAYYGLIPGNVQNLRSITDTSQPSVTLSWDKPDNVKTAGDVTTYDIRFKPYGRDSEDYCQSIKAPVTSVLLTRQSGLKPQTKYKFEVRARNDGHEGRWSGVSDYIGLNPGLVQNLTATVNTHKPSVTLNWDPPANARYTGDVTKYQICFWPSQLKLKHGNSEKKEVKGSTTTTVITRESGLRPLTTFTFEVRACSGDSVSQGWKPVSTFVALDPGPVRNLSAAVNEMIPSVTLSWKPPVNIQSAEELTGYLIHFNPLGTENYKEMTVSGAKTSVVLTRESARLVPLNIYHFQVKAQSGGGGIGEWNDVSAYYGLIPGKVKNLRSTPDTSQASVTLKWDKPDNVKAAGDVTTYDIRFKSYGRDSEDYHGMTVKAPATSALLTRQSGLKPLTHYNFEVRARNDGHKGSWSGVSIHIGLNPGPVQNLTATVNAHKPSVTLNWDPPANARYSGEVTKYQICFWPNCPKLKRGSSEKKEVKGSTTNVVITRESGLRPLTTFTFEVRACCGNDVSQEWRTVSTFVALDPGPVRHLSADVDENVPSATLSWKPPVNIQSASEVTEYQIHFYPFGSELFNEMTVLGSTNMIVLTRETGLVPLVHYHFQVRAKSGHKEGEWRDVSAYYALVPGPVQNLRSTLDTNKHSLSLNWDKPSNTKTSGDVTAYEIRFRPTGSKIGEDYCKMTVNAPTTSILLTEESGLQSLTMYDFEVRARNDGHEGKWSKLETTGVVRLDSQSQEYRNLCEKFRRDWARGKGPCPPIITIAKIINPVVSERFESYRDMLHVRAIEQYYHGTRFSCDLADSAELCNNQLCGVCGIARKGFDPQRINSTSFQRFGRGFYFAPNSSKAHDYAVGNRFGASAKARNACYSSVILCDIAPGRKYTLRFRDPHLSKPPSGYDSIYGESKGAGKGELNYDELVIFDHRAIHPRYIIFCRT